MDSRPSEKVFYPDSRLDQLVRTAIFVALAAFLFVLLLFALITIVIRGTGFEPLYALILAGVGLLSLLIALGCYTASHTRLVTKPTGIEFYDFGYSIRTTWDNLERIALVPMSYNSIRPETLPARQRLEAEMTKRGLQQLLLGAYVEAIILRQPVFKEKSWWAIGIVPLNRMIPLSDFKWWRHGELGQELKKYAPQLFVERESKV